MESRWGRDFPPFQTGPGAQPVSCKMGTRFFPGVKCSQGVLLTAHSLLVEEQSYTSTHPLGHTGPVTGSLYLFFHSLGILIIECCFKFEGYVASNMKQSWNVICTYTTANDISWLTYTERVMPYIGCSKSMTGLNKHRLPPSFERRTFRMRIKLFVPFQSLLSSSGH